MKDIDAISGEGIDIALRLHKDLGPGLLGTVYETVLAAKLAALGYEVARQVAIPIEFEGLRTSAPLREPDKWRIRCSI